MLMRKVDAFRVQVRSVFRRTFHLLLGWLGIRRLREHSFFATLLARPTVLADLGAHRGEFFGTLKFEHPVWRAVLVEADPALAESLKQTFAKDADVIHAAVVAKTGEGPVAFIRSMEPESSSIFMEWSAAHGIAEQVEVPAIEFSKVIRQLGGRVDLVKLDVEGAEIGVLQSASASDLASCGQLTVEFHDKRPPFTRSDVDSVCRRLRSEGFGIVNANWPYVNDVFFVNLKSMPAVRRMEFRCRMGLANALFIIRRAIFASGYS
jgi:methyltransferase, FkbM family